MLNSFIRRMSGLLSLSMLLLWSGFANVRAMPGDVNNDTAINGKDTAALSQALLGRGTPPGDPDCNHDGKIDIADLVYLVDLMHAYPADPLDKAPPADPTIASDIFIDNQFLFTGADPIQSGVTPGALKAQSFSIVRGRVLDRFGAPLPGVTVRVLFHPEFGTTRSRADGLFDMAVNGGGLLSFVFTKPGYLSVQRAQELPWRDYEWLPDIMMKGQDAKSTLIPLGAASPQMAVASPVGDADGTRTSVLLFNPGTSAVLKLPDGSTTTVAQLHVRATEYTVGPNGMKAMPAVLPQSTAYTYCVELSADEADAAGATSVNFNQPVMNYVDNYLNMPTGMAVPAGTFDRTRGVWVPAPDGRVIEVLSISNGMANLDTLGGGTPDNGVALGITDAERQQIASRYSPGATFWRVPVQHFSSWDYNWPYGPPAGATGPKQPPPKSPAIPGPCTLLGSIIEAQNQTLGEDLDVVGTPYLLHYHSDRVPGRKTEQQLVISLSGPTTSPQLKRIELEVSVAGQLFKQTFTNAPNQTFVYTWDKMDAYGRQVQGSVPATVRIGYVYPAVYQTPSALAESFGALSGSPFTINRPGLEITVWQENETAVGSWDARALGLGGWTLDVHHFYDPNSRTLYLGNGQRRTAGSQNRVISTIAGTSGNGPLGDGGPATKAHMNQPESMAIAPDGTLYVADQSNNRVRKIDTNGIITTYAGGGTNDTPTHGDEGLATSAVLSLPWGIQLGPDGTLYIGDSGHNTIRTVTPDRKIHTIAGNLIRGFGGDGGPGTSATLANPFGSTLGTDGSVYISDNQNQRIRRLAPNGIITTAVGSGPTGSGNGAFGGDGGPATQARLYQPEETAFGPDGSLYICDLFNNRIRKVGTNGIITTVAGNGQANFFGDGGPATLAALNGPSSVIVLPDSSFYFVDYRNNRIRYVDATGIISTIAGTGNGGTSPDGTAAAQADFSVPVRILRLPDDTLLLAERDANKVRKIAPALPGFSSTDIAIASSDGSELYQFDRFGRHLRTVNTLSNKTIYSFSYDGNGLLVKITDQDGIDTFIDHDASGAPTRIRTRGGKQTLLGVDAIGYLNHVTDPLGNTTALISGSDGLLTHFIDPKHQTHVMTYDALGRLIKDEDPRGGFTQLARSEALTSFSVTATTAEGRTRTFLYETLPGGVERRTNINCSACGAKTIAVTAANGTVTITESDGTVRTNVYGADPRWGMQSPFLQSQKIRLPSTLEMNIAGTRVATLGDQSNPLSLLSQTETYRIGNTQNQYRTYTTVYDAVNQRVTVTSPMGQVQVFKYDDKDRMIAMRPDAAITSFTLTYGAQGQLTDAVQGGESTHYAYDAQDRITTRTNALGQTTRFSYDADDQLTSVTTAAGHSHGFGYDANGNRTTFQRPNGGLHTLNYDSVDSLDSYAAPSNPAQTMLYNLDRQLVRTILPSGRTIRRGYDNLARPVKLGDANSTVTLSYADATNRVTQLARTPATAGTIQRTYLKYDGDLITSMSMAGAAIGQFTYTYDQNFLVTGISMNNGAATTLAYDKDGLLQTFGPFNFTRNGPRRVVSQLSDNSLNVNYSYTGLGLMLAEAATVNSLAFYQANYTRNNVGLVTRKVESVAGNSITYDYQYDADGQLTQVKQNNAVTELYTYDANGNRLTRKLGANAVESLTYDTQDRLTQRGSTSYNFDADGFMTQRGSDTFQYSPRGELLQATVGAATVTYTYDGLGRRVARTEGGQTTQYLYGNPNDPLQVTASRDAANVLTTYFYDSVGKLIALKQNTTLYYVATNSVGTPLLVSDASGVVVKQITYDTFGNVQADSNAAFVLLFGFAGGLADNTTGLVRFGARDYDPAAGRWTARDPILFSAEQANLYVYVGNNPVSRFDYTGLEEKKSYWQRFKDGVGAIFGAKKKVEEIKKKGEKGAELVTDVAEVCIAGEGKPKVEQRFDQGVTGFKKFLKWSSSLPGVGKIPGLGEYLKNLAKGAEKTLEIGDKLGDEARARENAVNDTWNP